MNKRRVGGSGWAGVYGSFIGLGKAKLGSKLSFRPKKSPQIKPATVGIDLAALPDDVGIKTAAKRAMLIHADLEKAKSRVAVLENQLSMAMDKFKIAQNATTPGTRRPRARKLRKEASQK